MFRNIGKKIKTLAKVICWIGIICSVLYGLLLLLDDAPALGLRSYYFGYGYYKVIGAVLVAVAGSLFSWIGSFVLYGFGELIDKASEAADNSRLLVLLAQSAGQEKKSGMSTAPGPESFRTGD